MTENEQATERMVLTQLAHLNAVILGIVSGLLLGIGICIATDILILKGGPVIGPHLALLSQFFPGYRVTFVGSLIGLAYGFVSGFIIAYAVAFVYNWLADLRERQARRGQRSANR